MFSCASFSIEPTSGVSAFAYGAAQRRLVKDRLLAGNPISTMETEAVLFRTRTKFVSQTKLERPPEHCTKRDRLGAFRSACFLPGGRDLRRASMINCPHCRSIQIHQSKRKGLLETGILALMLIRPFRCEKCDLRFFRWSLTSTPNSSHPATSYLAGKSH